MFLSSVFKYMFVCLFFPSFCTCVFTLSFSLLTNLHFFLIFLFSWNSLIGHRKVVPRYKPFKLTDPSEYRQLLNRRLKSIRILIPFKSFQTNANASRNYCSTDLYRALSIQQWVEKVTLMRIRGEFQGFQINSFPKKS